MKKSSEIIIIFLFLFVYSNLHAQNSGEDLFKKYCSVCHTVSRGKLIGPDLANVQKRHSIDWIIKFVKSSQTMIKNGDKMALVLFSENNNIIMPDHNLSDVQIKTIIDFITNSSIDNMSTGNPSTGITQWKSLSEAGGSNITAGEMLFEGNFTGADPAQNGGPTCNSCHTVQNKAVMSGGTLGPDLTKAYTKYNEAGLLAIINDPPFPVMKTAYLNRPLTEDEVYNLAAFLKYVDSKSENEIENNYGILLIFPSLGVLMILVGFFSIMWMLVKKKSVNEKIFKRQIRSI